MKRFLLVFLLGAGAGALGYHYFTDSGASAQARQTRDQIVVGAEKVATNLKTRVTEISASTVEAMKEELAHTGTVIREKARAAGQSIADSTANARTTAAVKARLMAEPGISSLSINVDCTDGLVTLSGKVDSDEQMARAVKIAFETEGVQKVISTLQVSKGQ